MASSFISEASSHYECFSEMIIKWSHFFGKGDHPFIPLPPSLMSSWSPRLKLTSEYANALKSTFQPPGIAAAALSYYRKNFSPLALIQPLKYDTMDCPVLSIYGEEDGCIDSSLFPALHLGKTGRAVFRRGCTLKEVKEAGHFLHVEKPNEVCQTILNWYGTIDD